MARSGFDEIAPGLERRRNLALLPQLQRPRPLLLHPHMSHTRITVKTRRDSVGQSRGTIRGMLRPGHHSHASKDTHEIC